MRNVGRRVRLAAVCALVAVTVSGCTWWDPTLISPPPASESPEPTPPVPEPTPTGAPGEGPTARIPATCSELVSIDRLRAISGDVTEFPATRGLRRPDELAAQQLGALRCLWANGEPSAPWEQPDLDYAQAELKILPDAAASWAEYLAVYGPLQGPSPYGDNAIGPRCVQPDEFYSGLCQFDALIGTYWVEFLISGVNGGTAESEDELLTMMRQLTDPLVAAVSAAGEPAPQWTPPPTAPLDCETVLTDEQAVTLTGVADLAIWPYWDGPAVTSYFHASDATGAKRCALMMRDSDSSVGYVSFLPGGGWAFRDVAEARAEADEAVPIHLDGAQPDEMFIEQCAQTDEDCLVDMLVGEDWIQVGTPAWAPGKISPPEGVDILHVRSQVRAIAETVLANLHART